MPAYNEADDSDAWGDSESMTSTDDLSSRTGDLESIEDSDFEFLSRSSSHIAEDEESDSDDHASVHMPDAHQNLDASAYTGDNNGVVSSDDHALDQHLADVVLMSTELPRVTASQQMDDRTSTIQPSCQRRDTVTPSSMTPTADTPVSPHAQPFNILYTGSSAMKPSILRKIGQSLMAATIKERSTENLATSISSSTASFATDWSSGCTSVVPITDFDTSDAAPEVEFVEDSLVKLRVQDIDTLQGFTSSRASHFLCELDHNTRLVSCHHHHRRGRGTICPWFDNPDTCPSLVVYVSPVRGEKMDFGLQKLEAFAEMHHFPLLVVSDWEKSTKLYSFGWNAGNVPVPESQGRNVELGYEPLTPKKFFDLDSAEFGMSLWKGAAISQDTIKNTRNVFFFPGWADF